MELRLNPWSGFSFGGRRPYFSQAMYFLPRIAGQALAGALFALWAMTGAAHAQFTVCNQTLDVVNVAIGQEAEEEVFQTEGWWTIGANQCADVIREELINRFIYVYANDVFGQPVLGAPAVAAGSGTAPAEPEHADEGRLVEMCVSSKRFVIRGIESCWQRGHLAARFFEVDTRAVERWTVFLTPPDN